MIQDLEALFYYQVGGSLGNETPSYVERKADQQLYQALNKREFCYVFEARQMGKSSLIVKTRKRLQQKGSLCAIVDLSSLGSEEISPSQWYLGFVTAICLQFKLLKQFDLMSWWKAEKNISFPQRLSHFFDYLLKIFPDQDLYLFLDEIDSLLIVDFPLVDFLNFIRYCYNHRSINPDYNRLIIILVGVIKPTDLITDYRQTPFNIGKPIHLSGLTIEEITPLSRGLVDLKWSTEDLSQEILYWSGGQPFLTQKIFQLVCQYQQANQLNDQSIFANSANSAQEWIQHIITQNIIQHWEFQDEPEHFRTIRDRLLHHPELAGQLLGLYQQILLGQTIGVDGSREHLELLLSGLVINEAGTLKIKNLIYEQIFNLEWVRQQLENLRPYAPVFNAWIQSGQRDTVQLLRGSTLQDALVWAENKKLSELDYRFLQASQTLEQQILADQLNLEKRDREKAEFALTTVKQANHWLALARQHGQAHIKRLRPSRGWMLATVLITTATVAGLRWTGGLQTLEWAVLDQFFQLRIEPELDSRVVIITIDEPDIQRVGQYPLPDQVLANILGKLQGYQPRLIGLDLFRDLSVPPGQELLEQQLAMGSNVIGIEKVIGDLIAGPAPLNVAGRVGFVDLVFDRDGRVRRALLSLRDQDNQLKESFALQLVLAYLAPEGIIPQSNLPQSNPSQSHHMQLGQATLIPFQPNDGGYVRADAGGYQMLINYYGDSSTFQTFSLTELLADDIPPKEIMDRIVLIGSTTATVQDLSPTPYSRSQRGLLTQMPGVIIHANIISQLLQSALEGRPLLRVWPKRLETFWISLGAVTGVGLVWFRLSPSWSGIVTALSLVSFVAVGYGLFLQGWWIPVVPTSLAMVVALIGLTLVQVKQRETLQLRQTLQQLIVLTRERPTEQEIAIEYLKQGEGKEHQQWLERWLKDQDLKEPRSVPSNL
jgi:CHASE2 domain-containing sensor protein